MQSTQSTQSAESLLPKRDPDNGPEGNVLTAALVFVVALVLDGLSATPTTVALDVPTSLRTTALVLVCLVAAPPITAHWLFEQRGTAFVLLLLVAWVGNHEAALYARLSDALYTLGGCWGALFFFAHSAPCVLSNGRPVADANGRRENVLAFAAALLGYAGARIVRQGIAHAPTVLEFTATHSGITAPGLGVADDLVASALVFGGIVAISAAAIILMNHDALYEFGSSPVAASIAQLAAVAFTTALVVQIVGGSRMPHLRAIFGETACAGTADVCEAAFRARRLFAANSCSSSLWAVAVGLTALSFPYSRRCRTRKSCYEAEEARFRGISYTSGTILVISSMVVVGTLATYAPTTNMLPGAELVLLFVSIPVAFFGWAPIACLLHAAGFSIYVIARMGSLFGFSLRFLTHWCIAGSLIAVLLLAATTTASYAFQFLGSGFEFGRCLMEDATAICLTVLLSVQFFLINASLSLGAAYDGASLGDPADWTYAAVTGCVQHTISFFFAAALIASRFEPFNQNVNSAVLRVVWFASPGALFFLWGNYLLFGAIEALPYVSTGDSAALALAILASLAPWLAAGIVAC